MNQSQERAKRVLQEELRKRRGITKSLPDLGESEEGHWPFPDSDNAPAEIEAKNWLPGRI